MEQPEDRPANQLIADLATQHAPRWLPRLELVELPVGAVLGDVDAAVSHVYFPTTAIVSLLCLTENGSSMEVATIGNEGVVGVSLFMGAATTTSRAVVQVGGSAWRLSAQATRAEFDRAGAFMHLMLRFTQALITQMAQIAVCTRHHALDQQLCRWLLMRLDRLPGSQVSTTQEQIAALLGVRREGVTEAALKLQRAEVIRYARGHIAVLSRQALEGRTCECYAAMKSEYDRLLARRAVS